MKTFLLVVILVVVALATGASLFVRTAAREGPLARLDCREPALPALVVARYAEPAYECQRRDPEVRT